MWNWNLTCFLSTSKKELSSHFLAINLALRGTYFTCMHTVFYGWTNSIYQIAIGSGREKVWLVHLANLPWQIWTFSVCCWEWIWGLYIVCSVPSSVFVTEKMNTELDEELGGNMKWDNPKTREWELNRKIMVESQAALTKSRNTSD